MKVHNKEVSRWLSHTNYRITYFKEEWNWERRS
jgi:hypothetical protein